MELIDGKATATAIKAEIADEVSKIVAAGGKRPHLAAVLVGHDGGSETYVKNKVISCEQCGFTSTLIRYEDDVTEEELLACVDRLNKDEDVDGFIVQLPLPKHIDEQKGHHGHRLPQGRGDGFHPHQRRSAWTSDCLCFISATPLGIMTLLDRYNIKTFWQEVCHFGRSNIVGKADGLADDAEVLWRRHGHGLPLPLSHAEKRSAVRPTSSSLPLAVPSLSRPTW